MQTFRYVQASGFASSPRSLLPLRVSPQGSPDFSVRAYRALLPPHAPDMLSAGIQVIDGKRTFTFPDLQPCRLLQCPPSPPQSAIASFALDRSNCPSGKENCAKPECGSNCRSSLSACWSSWWRTL